MKEAAKVKYTAKQLTSSLLRAIAMAQGATAEEMKENWQIDLNKIHFHDSSTTQIAWNDVQAIQMFNALTGENLPVPEQATEYYAVHRHASEADGGYIAGMGAHRHSGENDGGFCWAVYHPGTALPQQAWAI
jgi:hypothetical protein